MKVYRINPFPIFSFKFIIGIAGILTIVLFDNSYDRLNESTLIFSVLLLLVLLTLTKSTDAEMNKVYANYQLTNFHFTIFVALALDYISNSELRLFHYFLSGLYLMQVIYHNKYEDLIRLIPRIKGKN